MTNLAAHGLRSAIKGNRVDNWRRIQACLQGTSHTCPRSRKRTKNVAKIKAHPVAIKNNSKNSGMTIKAVQENVTH